ncbi:hypothetical protein SAMN05216525_10187 [Bradyrhizobium sp. Gha]|nr:hypothetical protein SAMN05216525_10187 [Bradyrhizobium sp. Gha]
MTSGLRSARHHHYRVTGIGILMVLVIARLLNQASIEAVARDPRRWMCVIVALVAGPCKSTEPGQREE